MDLFSVIGLVGGLGLYAWGIVDGGSVGAFVNAHGIALVIGGTVFATMIYCPMHGFITAIKGGIQVFKSPRWVDPTRAIDIMSSLVRGARQLGPEAVENEIRSVVDDGFFLRAYKTCLSSPDEAAARNVLEREIIQTGNRHREIVNIYKTLGTISPMMGLMGTVIGIVSVLRNITDPAMVGASMGVAMSTAFYGILMAGLIFLPMAGKLRLRSIGELLSKEIIMEGMLALQFTTDPPSTLERKLLSYLTATSIGTRAKTPL
ncbi:MAG: MotA/TolQ/ExbB proton channel family protein [Elusimicrobia bacterium]|nr:MotA/TolQ/ExbB proton channel family protein [Elusimicrobiota bacterium]